jgi:hypothetical protein
MNAGSKGMYEHIDDPMTTVIADATAAGVTWVSEATQAGDDFVRAVAAGKGLHYASPGSATNDDMFEFCGNNLIFAGQEGSCYAEILVQFSSVDDIAFNFGFHDTVEEVADGGTLPLELDGTAIAANGSADTFVGIIFDVDADNDDLHCAWINDTVVGQADADGKVDGGEIRMKGMSLTASKWLYLRVELQDRGSGNGVRATFLAVDHNGKSISKEFNTSVDRACPLCYHFSYENRADEASICYIKHCNLGQSTADM